MRRAAAVFFALTTWASLAIAQPNTDDDGLSGGPKSPGITPTELTLLYKMDFASRLKAVNQLAFSDEQLRFWANKARAAYKAAPVSRGDANERYDVIIQLGHFGRKSGRTGGQGKFVSEQEMVALVGLGVAQKLSSLKNGKKPYKVLLVGADDYSDKLKSKIFIALHTDAAVNKCVVGPSVSYEKKGDSTGMHFIALALATTISKDATRFMNDNYTIDEAGYYAFRQFETSDFKGLLELSELTCPDQESILLEKAAVLSENLAIAVQFALRPPRMYQSK